MEVKINLSSKEHKELLSYCNLNDLLISSVVKDSFTSGFNIERYGLLNTGQGVIEKEVVKEVIKYIEVPVVEEKEVVKIEYVEIEKPIEVIREVKVEVPVERIVEVVKEVIVEKIIEVSVTNLDNICDKNREEELLLKIQELENKPPVEIIKEVIIEKESTDNTLKPKLDAIQKTVQKLREEILGKDRLIKEYEKTIEEIQKFQENKQAVYLNGSNLDDKLYK